MSEQKITEEQKLDVNVNSKYLEIRSHFNSAIVTEFLNSSTVSLKQTIRGLFLLNGACATAVIASGHISQFKYMLVMLALGALSSVVGALFVSSAQRKFTMQYIQSVMLVDTQFCENIRCIYSKDTYDYIKENRKPLPEIRYIDIFKNAIPACWFSVVCFSLAIIMFCISCN